MEKIPKKVKCIKSVTNSYTEGLEYPVTNKGFVIDNFNDSFLTKWNKGKGINDNQNSSFEPIWEEEYVANPMPKGACEIRVAKDIPKRTGGSSTPFIPKGSITWVLGVDTKNTYIERIKKQEVEYIHPEDNRYCSNIPAEYFELIEGVDYGDEEFVLPEKWCVKECKEVIEWSSKKFGHTNFVNLNSKFLHIGDDLISEYIFENKIREGYTEITFEQFKKYVLEKDVEEPDKKSKKLTKDDFVEGLKYSGKIYADDNNFYEQESKTATKKQKEHLEQCIAADKYVEYEEKKELEKWSAGTWVVIIKKFNDYAIGDIEKISEGLNSINCIIVKKREALDIKREENGQIKWFATKEEAKEFAVSLKEPESEFKVGDWIVCKDYLDCNLGAEFIVDKNKTYFHIKTNGKEVKYYSKEYILRKATKEEIENVTKTEKKDEVKLEIGKWYKLKKNNNCIAFKNAGPTSYGIGNSGDWGESIVIDTPKYWKLATNQEVEEALTKEAKRRGYEIGKRIKSFYGKTSGLHENQDKYSFYEDELFYNGCYVFQRGKWATIVEEEKPVNKCEYWECVDLNGGNKTNYTKGKIYKLCKEGMLISNKGVSFATPQESNSEFKPSTKEAYDLQEHRKAVTAENNPVWEEHVIHKPKSTPKPEYDPSKYTHLKYKIGEKVMYKGKECEVISFNTGAQNNYQYVIDNHGRSNKAFEENYSHNVECNHAFASEYDLSPVEKCVGIREQIKAENIIPYPEGGYWPEEYKQEQSLKTVKATMVKVDPLF